MKRFFTRMLPGILICTLLLTFLSACSGSGSVDVTQPPATGESDRTDDTQNHETPEEPIPTEEPTMTTEHSLDGYTYFFLGSSVTYGSAANGKSFVDYIKQRNDCTCIKAAVSGTTLVDNGAQSYVQRLIKRADRYETVDHFICQLSTNDASQNLRLGRLSDSMNKEDFNTSTIVGAIEYIIAFAQEKWNCPVTFYINPYYNSANYQKMVDALYEVQEKWGIGIIDFWNDEDARNMDQATRSRYMSDDIHPTAAGYEEWWTPIFEEYLRTH